MMEMGPECETVSMEQEWFVGFNPSYDGNGAGIVPYRQVRTAYLLVSILLMMEMGPESPTDGQVLTYNTSFNPSYDGNGAGIV